MTRIKHYAVTLPNISTGYVSQINRRVLFEDVAYEVIRPTGAEVTMIFTANPQPIRYKEARAVAKMIGGTVVQV